MNNTKTVLIYKNLRGNFGVKKVFIGRGVESEPGTVTLSNGRKIFKGGVYIWQY